MKKTVRIIVLLVTLFILQSCQDTDDIAAPAPLEIHDFIWKGLNQYYLWQAEVPNLGDARFANQKDLNTFLNGYGAPESLFNALRVAKTIDRFSWIVSDYQKLEGELQGTTKNNGVHFNLSYKPGSTKELFGWVCYISTNSDASTKNIQRGDLFTSVDGIPLTLENYRSLLFGTNETYTLHLADRLENNIVENGKLVSLTKRVFSENPILINKVIPSGSRKIGYLLYNGFYSAYDSKLNEAFGSLKTQGVTDLVLDLRYNGGGSITTATRLASMITGQFTGQVFAKQQWNSKINAYYEAENPSALFNYFTNKIGTTTLESLKLTKIYILTSAATASASELVINGLKPYLTVIQIGEATLGKNVGSVTLYDSPTFADQNRNTKHRYAMQPIVLKIINSAGFGDYNTGLPANILMQETASNLGSLGALSEPLLSTAIATITGNGRIMKPIISGDYKFFINSKSNCQFQNGMHLEKAPEGLLKALD